MYGGPAPHLSVEGYRYYISFIDEFTQSCLDLLFRQKYESTAIFFHFNKLVKCLQTALGWGGRGGGGVEYHKFQAILHDLGIAFHHPCPYTHQQ